MKKIFFYLFIILLFLLFLIFIFLATTGYETSRFNNLINVEAKKIDNNLNIDLKKILIKIDPKNLNLYLKTNKPKIIYQKIDLPIKEIKTYIKLMPLIKTNLIIEKILIETEEIPVNQFKKLIKNMDFNQNFAKMKRGYPLKICQKLWILSQILRKRKGGTL